MRAADESRAVCHVSLSSPQHPTEYLGGWRNQVCARVGAMVGLYSPLKALPQVRCYPPRVPCSWVRNVLTLLTDQFPLFLIRQIIFHSALQASHNFSFCVFLLCSGEGAHPLRRR